MTAERTLRATVIGHVEAAVWWASNGGDNRAVGALGAAVAEAAKGLAVAAPADPPPPTADLPSWAALGAGDVCWADLFTRTGAHPAERHIATAALLHAARTGVLGRLLDEVPRDGPPLIDEPLVRFGLRDGWCVPSPDGPVASEELRALAGVGLISDPAGWLRARLAFEADWFWEPLGQLPGAAAPVADFGAPGRAERFRAASMRLNARAAGIRRRAARALGAALGPRHRRVLEIGAVSPVWGAALAGEPARTIVDYPAVLGRGQPGVTAVGHDPLLAPPEGPFDVVVIDELLHTASRGPADALLGAAARCLSADGALVVVEPLLDNDRRGPPQLLATQVKVTLTGGGALWTSNELVGALRTLGLRPTRPRRIVGSHLSVARR